MYLQEVIEGILTAYCHGISVLDISLLVSVPEEDVNEIIDSYVDLFLEGWL